MDIIENPHRGTGLTDGDLSNIPYPSVDAAAPAALMARCFGCKETPLHALDAFGTKLWVKDERGRMDLGSFKALGAAYVIAHQAAETGADDLSTALSGRVYVTASAGNHGMSVAAGAAQFGAQAVVFLAETVPEGFAERLRGLGADVVRAGAEYEASMAAALKAADDNDWTLLSDSSWPGYSELPHRLMEGYTAMAAEVVAQIPEAPTHILLQAGVGGLAGACAAYFRSAWGNEPRIIVVEPEFAPALKESVEAGHMVSTQGPVSNMGRLDCKEASLIALKGLSRDADAFALISEEEGHDILPKIAELDLASTESGAAGIAVLDLMELGPEARVLCILSEEAEA